MSTETISIGYAITIIALVIISAIFLALFILHKDNVNEDIEIDNIYHKLSDNDKLSKDIDEHQLKEFKKMTKQYNKLRSINSEEHQFTDTELKYSED